MVRPARPGRLSRSADFERVFRQGRSVGNRFFVLHVFPRAAHDERPAAAPAPRIGLSVSRKVGGAVERNRVKRLLREAFAAEAAAVPADADVVVVARPEARELAERDGLPGVRGAVADLLGRSRARAGP